MRSGSIAVSDSFRRRNPSSPNVSQNYRYIRSACSDNPGNKHVPRHQWLTRVATYLALRRAALRTASPSPSSAKVAGSGTLA